LRKKLQQNSSTNKLAKKRVRVNSSEGTCNVFAENSYRSQKFFVVATLQQQKTALLCSFAQ